MRGMRRLKRAGLITFVCGPPGSGKTTYCQTHSSGRDLVWDLDVIAAGLNPFYAKNYNRPIELNKLLGFWRDQLVEIISEVKITNNAYIIIADAKVAKSLASRVKRSKFIELTRR
jgi:tRNA uridine 5-carbamoylmethylation protein Kti12